MISTGRSRKGKPLGSQSAVACGRLASRVAGAIILGILITVLPGAQRAEALDPPVAVISSWPAPLTASDKATLSFWASAPILVSKGVQYGIAPDGTPLFADVYRPDDKGLRPGVLVIHGGGWRAGSRKSVKAEARSLANAGFVAFAVDYRLAPGEIGDDHWPAQIEDLRQAMSWARDQTFVTSKVGAFGVSAGGHLAQYLATTGAIGDTRADAAASFSGPSKLDVLSDNPEYKSAVANLIGCDDLDLPECLARWQEASPFFQVSSDTTPIYMSLSVDDPLVHIDQLRLMNDHLEALGVIYRGREVGKGGHVEAVEPRTWNEMTNFLWRSLGPADEGVTYACTLDDGAQTCGGNLARFRDLVPGRHTFSVQAIDDEGNAGPPATYSWTIAPRLADVSMGGASFTPGKVSVPPGAAIQWVLDDLDGHTVTDITGMGLYHSGVISPAHFDPGTPGWGIGFIGAGVYKYACLFVKDMTGVVEVPMTVSPSSGDIHTTFNITWAAIAAPSGVVFDIQIKRPGQPSWSDWLVDQVDPGASFVPDASAGTYRFRAREQLAGKSHSSEFSPVAVITVTP